jgi:hypothetical protein
MARLAPADLGRLGFISRIYARIVFWITKRKLGRVVMPLRVVARHPALLRGYVGMEQAQLKSRFMDSRLKCLAELRVASLIGCPF